MVVSPPAAAVHGPFPACQAAFMRQTNSQSLNTRSRAFDEEGGLTRGNDYPQAHRQIGCLLFYPTELRTEGKRLCEPLKRISQRHGSG